MRKLNKNNNQRSKLRLKNAKNTFCNKNTDDGDTYKKHIKK